jgi:hypothetical protein
LGFREKQFRRALAEQVENNLERAGVRPGVFQKLKSSLRRVAKKTAGGAAKAPSLRAEGGPGNKWRS